MDKNKVQEKDIVTRDSIEGDYFFCRELNNMMIEMVKKNRKMTEREVLEDFDDDFKKGGVKIVEYKGVPVGFFQLFTKDNFLFINDFQVSPLFRNMGIGTYLLKLMEKEAIERGLSIIKLEVFLDNEAKSLYDKMGYKIESYTKSNSVIMEKILENNI
jgi:ribosomal protein S18 acetylase RimI-like enzyme